tara:strand:- start:38369 stop:39571 length:1203 start_codon:yes stop_codon:yes gene_type:complete
MTMTTRRELLKSLGVVTLIGGLPQLSLAKARDDARFVLLVLRGAVDGLALAAPYGDSHYEKVRGELAMPAPGSSDGLLQLDGLFGLHPSLQTLHQSYVANEAIIAHAIASPYRERSHFDGQDILESGAPNNGVARDGWLNRALAPFGSQLGSEVAIALAQNTPLVLRGDNSVTSWAPSRLPDADATTLERLQRLYAGDEFFATRLEQALRSQEIAGGMAASGRNTGNAARQFAELMESAARFLSTPNGPTIAVVELGGWDTHANQGASNGQLANRFAALDNGLGRLREGLGDHWSKTVVAVVTEFGRTVHVNGTRGTDHGTGTAAVVLGGAVDGGRVVADWPGLGDSDLYAGRDLRPTRDLRSLFKGLLADHLGLPQGFLDEVVFPDSAKVAPMRDLIRS